MGYRTRVDAFNLTLMLHRSCIKRHSICRYIGARAKTPPAARINTAIRDLQPDGPALAHLATLLYSLWQDPNFSDADIREVETTVRRILIELFAEPEE
jgi:hypothetical protein